MSMQIQTQCHVHSNNHVCKKFVDIKKNNRSHMQLMVWQIHDVKHFSTTFSWQLKLLFIQL